MKRQIKVNHKNSLSFLVKEIQVLIEEAREGIARNINSKLLLTYWNIGRLIVEREFQDANEKSSRERILELSKILTREVGRGFSRSNLFNMRSFYLTYKSVQTLSGQTLRGKVKVTEKSVFSNQLSWSHYCELLKIDDSLERNFYEHQAIKENWSIRELKRHKKSALFHRLALSRDKKGILALARKGQVIKSEGDVIKDPYVLEFLNIPEKHRYTEKKLEQEIIDNLQDFLLELGKGFAFIARQYRVTLNNRHYRIDLVFYHRILKCFILIDLKIDGVEHYDIGQMNMYLGYFETEMNVPDDNPPIGIILTAEKDSVMVEYALHGISNKIFVSKYQLYLPDKKLLQRKVQEVMDKE